MVNKQKEAAAETAASDGTDSEIGCLPQSLYAHFIEDEDGCQSQVHPRSGKTGVSHTWPSEGGLIVGGVVIDWLAFTLPCEALDDVRAALVLVSETFGKLTGRPNGYHGYEYSACVLATGTVAWSEERPESGVHVALPSSALGLLARHDEAVGGDVRGFLRYVSDCGGRMTRLDLALDDRREILPLDVIDGKLERREYVSSWRKRCKLDSYEDGVTFYLGSRRSDSFLRIYDKRAEVLSKGADEDPGPWVRCELELKGERAQLAIETLVRRGCAVVPAILYGQVAFKEPCNDANKSRWPVCEWWRRFLGYVERMVLRLPTEAPTLEASERWVREQVAPTVSTLLERYGGDLGWLLQLIDDGRSRRPPWQRAALAALEEVAL